MFGAPGTVQITGSLRSGGCNSLGGSNPSHHGSLRSTWGFPGLLVLGCWLDTKMVGFVSPFMVMFHTGNTWGCTKSIRDWLSIVIISCCLVKRYSQHEGNAPTQVILKVATALRAQWCLMLLLRQAIAINDEHVATVASNSGDAKRCLLCHKDCGSVKESAAVCYCRNVTVPCVVVVDFLVSQHVSPWMMVLGYN